MNFDEKISQIKTEIETKEGKEWLGLTNTTEERLESLLWYLKHPKIKDYPRLLEESIDLFFKAKESGFLRMEDIIRKLDQLNIKLGKYEYTEKPQEEEDKKKLRFQDYPDAIKTLKKKIQISLKSTLGMSLADASRELLITFFNYLNHPQLESRPELVDEFFELYETAERNDFNQMDSLKNFLDELEINLGTLTEEMKSFNVLDDAIKKVEEEKLILQKKIETLEDQIQKLNETKNTLNQEKEKLFQKVYDLEGAKKDFQKEQDLLKEKITLLENKITNLEDENQQLKDVKQELEKEKEHLNNHSEKIKILESENNKLKAKIHELEDVSQKIEALEDENHNLKVQNKQLSSGLQKLEGLIQKFQEMQQNT